MIFGNINHSKTYSTLHEDLLRCFEYAKDNSLIDYEKGTYTIDGDDIFVNIVEYKTCEKEDRFWEAHKKYIDVHLMLDGCERIDINFIENLEQKYMKKRAISCLLMVKIMDTWNLEKVIFSLLSRRCSYDRNKSFRKENIKKLFLRFWLDNDNLYNH